MHGAVTTPASAPAGGRQRAHRKRRRWVRAAAVVLIVLALAAVWLATAGEDPAPGPGPGPTAPSGTAGAAITAAWRDGVVVVEGDGWGTSTPVDVSARYDGGSGSALMVADGGGSFAVAFRPPAGGAAEVELTATSGGDPVRETVAVEPADTPAASAGDGLLVVPTTGAPATPLSLPASGLSSVAVPPDIAADCSTDVSRALNSWLRSVPDGSEVRFAERGCYRVDTSLLLQDRSDLVIEGNGSTFRAETLVPTPETNRAQWWLDNGSRIALRNMTLVGMNPKPRFNENNEFDHNVFIRGTSDVTIDGVHGRKAYGDFIAIAHGTDRETIPSGIEIRNSSAETVGRMAISCVACDGVTVEDSVFNDVGYHVFDLEVEDDGWPTRGIRYTGNTIGRHGYAFFSVGTPYRTEDNDVSDILIADNFVTQPGATEGECVPAISFLYNKVPVRGVVIEGNSLVSRTDAIVVTRASDVVIRGNTATLVGPTCGDPVGIRTESTEGAQVSGNRLSGYE
jgi:hypothetical protein